jgi:2-keto-3-deoxy-L-rhamnonate aldolase RhmA
MNDFFLKMILNQPAVARYAAMHGVDHVFVDLEIEGKYERQGHRDTLISRHTMEDVSAIREAIGSATLLVRLNPWSDRSAAEIDEAISRGANILMLPMFRRAEEVAKFCQSVRGRVRVVPLVETPEAVAAIESVAAVEGVTEMYVGLNDLHIASGSRFMFEPLVNGVLDRVAETLHRRGMPFGFGGIARIGEGQLPAELILGEHVRLGSTSAILSRTFHRQARSIEEIGAQMDFDAEVGRIRATLEGFRAGGDAALRENHHKVVAIVSQILATFASGG